MPLPSLEGSKLPDKIRREVVDALALDQIAAVLDCHFYEEHAGKGRHGEHVRGHSHDADCDVWVGYYEVDDGGCGVDGLHGAVEEVVRDRGVVGETAEDV